MLGLKKVMCKELIVGDNPFHGISHLSQERARNRNKFMSSSIEKANLVLSSFENGATGFMFSVSEITLSILKAMRQKENVEDKALYAIVPYTFEYVRTATQTGTPSLAKRFVTQLASSRDVKTLLKGFKALTRLNPSNLLETYIAYEISRIKSSIGKHANLASVFLHEVLTDMALALDLEWVFTSHIAYLSRIGIAPGFHTRNFPYLIEKFDKWQIDLNNLLITTPFNKVGFQMNPSRDACEKTLKGLSNPIILAISVLASGYVKPPEAIEYIAGLDNIRGVVAGVSNEKQAIETFNLFQKNLSHFC